MLANPQLQNDQSKGKGVLNIQVKIDVFIDLLLNELEESLAYEDCLAAVKFGLDFSKVFVAVVLEEYIRNQLAAHCCFIIVN